MQIDLKNAIIQFRDGDVRTLKVNNSGGYSSSATTMVVDGSSATRADGTAMTTYVGRKFTVTGSTAVHTITSVVGGTTPTSLTFTPGLTGSVVDNADVTIKGLSLELNIGEGTLSYSEKRPIQYMKNRGKLGEVRKGDEEPMDVKMDLVWEFLTAVSGSGIATPEDFLKNRGEGASLVTSDTEDPCRPFAIDIEVVHTPPCSGVDPETIVLEDFRYEELGHDPKAGTLSVTGKCNRTEALVARG